MTGIIRTPRRPWLIVAGLVASLIPAAAAGQSQSPSSATAPPATFVWASHGDPADPMVNTGGVTIAPDGNLWVADTGNSRFGIIDPDGTFLEYWGTEGTGPGEFMLRRANGDGFANVAFAPDGSFFVLDAATRRIIHFAADRTFLEEWGGFGNAPGLFADPLWIAVDSDGNVLVVDDIRNVVERLSPDGTALSTFEAVPRDVGTADSMALGPDGDIYVSTCCPQATVQHYDPDGTLIWSSQDLSIEGGPLDQAGGMAVDAEGIVFVGGTPDTTPDRIRVIGPDGAFLTRFGGTGEAPEDVGFPFALALDGQGALYATDYIDGSVKKLQLGPELLPTSAD
jgi:sugar lactone lactonase YvrE